MYGGYNIVAVTPAGRRRYMKLLASYILPSQFLDRWDIWVNTTNQRDIDFFRFLEKNFSKVNVIPHPENKINGNASINPFHKLCCDPKTVYIRFDDDIVWIEPSFFEKILYQRLTYANYFLTFPLIVNNAACTRLMFIHIFKNEDVFMSGDIEGIAWGNPEFAYKCHKFFLNLLNTGHYSMINFRNIPVGFRRVSINCMSWFGRDYKKFNGKVIGDEEEYLTVIKPVELGKSNLILGNVLCSHYAFYPQRVFLDQTEILQEYEKVLVNTAPEEVKRVYDIVSGFGDFGN